MSEENKIEENNKVEVNASTQHEKEHKENVHKVSEHDSKEHHKETVHETQKKDNHEKTSEKKITKHKVSEKKKTTKKKSHKKTVSEAPKKAHHAEKIKETKKTAKKAPIKKRKESTFVWKILALVIVLALIFGIIVYFVYKNQTKTATGDIIAKTGLNIIPDESAIHEGTLVEGAADAPIVIYVYTEYLCPYCKKFFEETESQIVDKYVKTGYARLVHKQFTVHGEPAVKLSLAALCAAESGDDKFNAISEKFFSDKYFQTIDEAKLKEIIESIGLNYTQTKACIDSGKYNNVITQDMTDGQNAGVAGTPSISINGKLIVGAQPFSVFDSAIQSLINGENASKTEGQTQENAVVDTSKDPESNFYVISDKTCLMCDTTQIVSITKEKLFPKLKVIELDINDELAKEILDTTKIKFIPAYVFSSDIKQAANYVNVEQAMIQEGQYVYINPGATGGQGKLLVPVETGNAAIKGNESAKVTIVEFSDFQCPYCEKFYSESYKQILTDYVDKGLVKLAFRNFPLPFHNNAKKAAEAAECAKEQDKFWEMHDKLFENQNALDVDSLKSYAKELGLDEVKFNNCLDDGEKTSVVDDDLAYGESIGVSGTPAFYINGMQIAGALPFENFKEVIDSELAKN